MASLPFLDTLQVSAPFDHGFSEDKCEDFDDAQTLNNEESASEFEFSISVPAGNENFADSFMLPADQLFFKGQLRPLYCPHPSESVGPSCVPEAVSQEISPSFPNFASTHEAFPLSPKAPTCTSSLKELLGLKKPQIHGDKDVLPCQKLNNKHKASKAPLPLRILLKSSDAAAMDSSQPLLAHSVKEDETGSNSNSSDSSPPSESSDHHEIFVSRSEAPRGDHFLAKCVSLNFKFLEQKLSSPRNSISRDDAEESISSKLKKDVSSPRNSVSRNDWEKDGKCKVKKENCSPRNSISREKGAKDATTRGKVSADILQVKKDCSRRSSGSLEEGANDDATRVKVSGDNFQVMNSDPNSGEQSCRRKSGVFSPGRSSVGGSHGDKSKMGRMSMLSRLERSSSSSPQSVRKKYEQMRNARQRDGRRGLERSTSYSSSVKITPVLNVPSIYISPAMRCGKGSKTNRIFGFSKLFASKKEQATRISQTVNFQHQTRDG